MISSERQEKRYACSPRLPNWCPRCGWASLMANLSYMARGLTNESIWDMEDDEMLQVARKHLEEWRRGVKRRFRRRRA